jgi:hypothetical protein
MEASKSLRRPTSWQDFETLCKKLWGEIWSCPEIKKNGRSGHILAILSTSEKVAQNN